MFFKRVTLLTMLFSLTLFAMSANEVQTAPKEKLLCIKGIGVKKLQAIITYREENSIKTLQDLLNVKGIGVKILENIKNDIKKKSCTNIIRDKNITKTTKVKKLKKIDAK